MATTLKLYAAVPDAYRGRRKVHGPKTGTPKEFVFSDGRQGMKEMLMWLTEVCVKEDSAWTAMHSARISFNEDREPGCDGDWRGRVDEMVPRNRRRIYGL